MNMRIISAKDHGDSFRTLESGRAVAFMMDDALLAGERAKAKKPDNWEIVGTPQSKEAYGCMLRKDDPQFKKLIDDTVARPRPPAKRKNGLINGSKTRFRRKI
jgi:glutamate/aspartate transport system substrate-binding protein